MSKNRQILYKFNRPEFTGDQFYVYLLCYPFNTYHSFFRFSANSIYFCWISAASLILLASSIATYCFRTYIIFSVVLSDAFSWDISCSIILPFMSMLSIHFYKFSTLLDRFSKLGLAICVICWKEAIIFSLLLMLFMFAAMNYIFVLILCKPIAKIYGELPWVRFDEALWIWSLAPSSLFFLNAILALFRCVWESFIAFWASLIILFELILI